MSVTPVLWVIIPIQVVLLIIIIRFCIQINKNKVRGEDLIDFITMPEVDEKSFKSSVIRKIVSVVRSHESKGKTIVYDDLSDLIENELTKNDSIIRSLINSEVILGLSGTFLGLIIALSNINPASISGNLTAGDFINSLIQQMDPFLKGLSTAFGASFSGVVCMLIGNLVYSSANSAREREITDLLYVISNELLPSIASAKPEEKIYQSVDHFSEKVEMLTEKIKDSLFDFNSRFEVLIKKTTDSFNSTLDKILDENKIALNSQITNLQSSANYLMEIKTDIVNTAANITKTNEKQFYEVAKLHQRIEEGNSQFQKSLKEYLESQAKLIGLFDVSENKQTDLIESYSKHFLKLNELGELAKNIIIQTSESLNVMLEKTNRQIEEHFNNISKEYDRRLLEAVEVVHNKSSEVFDKFNNNSVRLDELIGKTAQNANLLEDTLKTNLNQLEEALRKNINNLTDTFKENLTQLGTLNKQLPQFLNGMQENNSQIKTTISSFDTIIGRFESNIQNNVAEYFKKIEKVTGELESHFKNMQQEYKRIISSVESFRNSLEVRSDLVKEFQKTVESTMRPIDAFRKAGEDVRLKFDSFEEKFLEKLDELFVKIIEQKEIPVNLFSSGDGGKRFRDRFKTSDKLEHKRIVPLNDFKPMTLPSDYFKHDHRKGKEATIIEDKEKVMEDENKLLVYKRNRFTRFLFKLVGLGEETTFKEEYSIDEKKDVEEKIHVRMNGDQSADNQTTLKE